ncbi:hypothetical protein Bca4012_080978 [Brassica carinata]
MDTRQARSQLASAGTREEIRRIPAVGGDMMKKNHSLGAVFSQIQIDHQIDVSRRKTIVFNQLYNLRSSWEEEAIGDNRRETIESRRCRKRQSNIAGKIPVISRRQTPWEFDAESKADRLSPEEKG